MFNEKMIIFIALFVMAVICLAVYLVKTGKAKKLKTQLDKIIHSEEFEKSVYSIMVFAEQTIVGTQMGQERLAFVCGKINAMLPAILQPIITAELLKDIVNEFFEKYAVKKDGHWVVE